MAVAIFSNFNGHHLKLIVVRKLIIYISKVACIGRSLKKKKNKEEIVIIAVQSEIA